ncbi:hypothetical protein JCM10212_000799 [Sporobolomyces blumeae]
MTTIPTGQTARQEALLEFSALGLPDHLPLGMYVFPTDIFRWSGFLSLHRGYYSGSLLHFTVTIPSNYPASPPLVHFETPTFHPLIEPTSGRMRLDHRYSPDKWRPRRDFVWNVLHTVKAAFKRRALDELREKDCANLEAYRLYRDQTSLFAKLAAQSSSLSHSPSTLYSSNPSRLATASNPPASSRMTSRSTPDDERNPGSTTTPFAFRKLDKDERDAIMGEVERLAQSKIIKASPGTAT